MTDDTYNGWTNRETWAVALHINNDEGWQMRVHEMLLAEIAGFGLTGRKAGELIKDSVEELLTGSEIDNAEWQRDTLHDIGSLYRVDWDSIGQSFLSDIEGDDGVNYDEACIWHATNQGLDPITEALAAADVTHRVEQTGGMTMVVVVPVEGGAYAITDDRGSIIVARYPGTGWTDGELGDRDWFVVTPADMLDVLRSEGVTR